MWQFFVDMRHNPFLGTGLIAGGLASLACGVMGPYVITRRIVFLVGAIAHMAVGGLGAAVFVKAHYPDMFAWLRPIHGAMVAALLGAMIIGVVRHHSSERHDTLIGALWAVGMAFGLLLLKFTPGYQTDLLSYLFGNVVYVSWADVRLIALLDVIILAILLIYYKQLLGVCLDEQQAALQGINVFTVNIVLLSLVALTVICLIQIVGLILVLALLTLPAATAAHYAGRLPLMMAVSVVVSLVVTTLPRVGVYGTGISPEPAIVLAAGGVYLISVIGRGRLWRGKKGV